MLNLGEFNSQIDRLKAVFGETRFPNERTERIFSIVRELSPYEWRLLVNRIIDYAKAPPTPGDFRLDVREIIKAREHCFRPEELITCPMCNGLGGRSSEENREIHVLGKTLKVPVWIPCLECQGDRNSNVKCEDCQDTHFVSVRGSKDNAVSICPACHPRAVSAIKQENAPPRLRPERY